MTRGDAGWADRCDVMFETGSVGCYVVVVVVIVVVVGGGGEEY